MSAVNKAQVNMEVKCDLCDSDSNIRWKCINCDEWLCCNCKSIHAKSRASRDHQLANLADSDFSTLEDIGKYCTEHPTEAFQMYCKNCECPLCLACVTSEHKQHEFVTLYHIVEEKKMEITDCLDKLKTVSLIEFKKSLISLRQTRLQHSEHIPLCVYDIKKQGQAIKKEVDNAVSEFVNDIEQTAEENKERLTRLEDQVTKRISFIQKRIKRCEDRRRTQNDLKLIKLASEMKSALERYQDYSPTWKIAFPTLVPAKIDKFDIRSLFGKMVCEYVDNKVVRSKNAVSVNLHKNIQVVSQFSHNVRAYSIATDSNTAWIGRDQYLAKLDSNGKRLKRVNLKFDVYCLANSKSGDILLGSSNKLYKFLKEGFFVDFINFGLWFVTDISITEENEILVSLRNMYIGKAGKVVRLTEKGKLIKTIKYDKETGIMFKWPEYLTHTRFGDIWVTDTKENCVVVSSAEGGLKFKYSGFADILMNQDFQPRGLVTNKCDQILIADINNHAVHLVDKDGDFLQFLLTMHHGLESPVALCQNKDGSLWVVCNDGKIINVNYLT